MFDFRFETMFGLGFKLLLVVFHLGFIVSTLLVNLLLSYFWIFPYTNGPIHFHLENLDIFSKMLTIGTFPDYRDKTQVWAACCQILSHFVTNNVLYQHQYGFWSGHSTEHALLKFTENIFSALNKSKYNKI